MGTETTPRARKITPQARRPRHGNGDHATGTENHTTDMETTPWRRRRHGHGDHATDTEITPRALGQATDTETTPHHATGTETTPRAQDHATATETTPQPQRGGGAVTQ